LEIDAILAKLQDEGFVFPETLVKNYLLSIRTKPFVLLTGMSGGGKTALTWLVADALGEPYCPIAVKPNWTDSHDLSGFYNPITGRYERQEALDFILEAASEYADRGVNARRYHLCLDEMNLSRVEYYFAEILSAMERPTRTVYLHSERDRDGVPGT
jgi:5-methylcytosine-specific restriction endonuclease McrBC GTP-binding regulatory subunit McrB